MIQFKGTVKKPTLEILGYIIILFVAAGLRFTLLGGSSLNDHEANLALQALQVSMGEDITLSGEPGYIALTAIQFFVFGASDFMARFWPAIFGTCLVLLPLLYREWLGKSTALLMAGLIALDPVLIGVSRTADGRLLALVGLLAAAGFWLRKRPVLSGICLGGALLGGVGLWLGLLVLAVLVLVFSKQVRTLVIQDDVNAHPSSKWAVILGIAAITMLLISTLLLTNPNGISAVGSSLVEYFSSWGHAGSVSLPGVSMAWFLTEIPIILFGLWGLIEGLLRHDVKSKGLGIWWGVALVVALINPDRGLQQFFWVSIPMLTLAAIKLVDLFKSWKVENHLVFLAETGLVIMLVGFSFLNFINLVNSTFLTPEDYRDRIIGTLLPLILLIAMTVLLSWGWSNSSTRKGLMAGILLLFCCATISTAWKSAGLGSRPEFELRGNGGYPVGEDSLRSTIEDISRWNTGTANGIDIQVVGFDLPSVTWALRDYENLSFETTYNPNLTPSIILTPASLEIEAKASYRGQKLLWAVNTDQNNLRLIDWMKWNLFRTAPTQNTELILWARNDLFPGAVKP